MADINTRVNRYLKPPEHAFWNWSEDGEVIVETYDETTIVFRQELETILQRHVSRGLPSLSSILLIIAACRNRLRPKSKLTFTASLSEEFRRLDCVSEIPPEFRAEPAAKSELTAMICETDDNRTSVEVAVAVVDALRNGLALEFVRRKHPFPATAGRLLDDLKPLREGLSRFDVEAFKLRLETGLEQEIQPAEIDEPMSVRVRKLLDRLQSDEEFSGIARLARNLLALVHLPRPLGQPDEIPVGGVSDIANRGTLDRLLLSELAQDDDLLMMRLAMNEAMYLRRETPPKNPPRTRLLLVDMGLRMWGTPRVMATAVAMSFAAMNGPFDLRILHGEGKRLFASDLSTRKGLVDHLKVLDPQSHPGEAFADLPNSLEKEEDETDVVLVTSSDVLLDRDFQEWLKSLGEPIGFVAAVSRTGHFQLLERTRHGTRLLREAKLNLDQLLAPAKKTALPLVDQNLSPDLPQILALPTFPLRLSQNIIPKQTWRVEHHGVLAITNDRRLMHWDNPKLGGRQITDRLSSRRLLWCQTRAERGCTHFVVGNPSKPGLELGIVDIEQGHCELVPLETAESHVNAVCEHAGVLLVIHANEIDVCDIASGERIHAMTTPKGFHWIQGRFFGSGQVWKALSYDGMHPRFAEVKTDASILIALFDVEGIQGPVGIASMDYVRFGLITTDQYMPLSDHLIPPINILAISPNGKRVLARHRGQHSMKTVVIDVPSRTVSPAQGDPYMYLDPEIWNLVRPRHVRNRLGAIGTGGQGLLLQTSSGGSLCLDFVERYGQFRLFPILINDYRLTLMRRFKPIPGPPGAGYKLHVAEWSDGSRAFLDSRGLLHLKSSDPTIPESTFVLNDQNVAGWCATGEVWGEMYYTGDTSATGEKRIQDRFLSNFVSRLR